MKTESTPKIKLLLLAPTLALISVLVAISFNLSFSICATIGITTLTAVWWITEAIPIPATSLVPIALLPLLGVIDHKAAASSLGSHVILLLMGAFMLSKGMEKSGVHKRLAVNLIQLFGADNPRKILFGIMLTAAVLSMWVSNTATTLMLLPLVVALANGCDSKRFGKVLLLGVAYAASVGGVGTLIGTPPNVIFAAVYQQQFNTEFSFLHWMKIGVPVVLIAIPLMALWLSRGLTKKIQLTLPTVGMWSQAEIRVLMVFSVVAMMWIFRSEPFGGWTGLIGTNTIGDSTIALLGVAAMFCIKGENHQGEKSYLLDWHTANQIPWGMLLLFAGGICIAKAFAASGLSELLGQGLTGLAQLPSYLMILMVCLAVTFTTEVTSNTATTTLLMPVLAAAGVAAGIDPKLLMIPAAMSASCAFMLPVATAPNAIVYGADKFDIKTMMQEGVVLNFILAAVVSTNCFVLLG
ncbi:Na+/dicarboxylate symporter [Catenovulum agarivorans DS-2]|uniref:Na+/dicarboxylate symporter n=1 Tax=Catenovulum agarivorans DS-2 TaxID=1328313 RepID=W7QEI4_9ALTE|nr:SLC13 family permease [Catenovulum agarivorans]EWH10331.1 Na+/dicarboxylate symporter [Catenovulum agarivorans DS-2]